MSKKRYGRAWKRIRDRYASQHPNCELCLMTMRVSKATEIHHIVPISRGGKHIEANLMALCHECHTWIHTREQKGENNG